MRSIFHQILERYLASEQHAFDASPRELWPDSHAKARWQAACRAHGDREYHRVYREPEPQS